MFFTRGKRNIKANKGYVLFVTTILLFTASVGVAALSSYHLNQISVSHNYHSFDYSKNEIQNNNTLVLKELIKEKNSIFADFLKNNSTNEITGDNIVNTSQNYNYLLNEFKLNSEITVKTLEKTINKQNLKLHLLETNNKLNKAFYYHLENNDFVIESIITFIEDNSTPIIDKVNSKLYKKGAI